MASMDILDRHNMLTPMVRFAANLSMMFAEIPFLDRFGAAAEAGFAGVEFLFPYQYEREDLAAALSGNGLSQVLFNFGQGAWEDGERGIGAIPGREEQFANALEQALDYAAALRCPRLHAMAGLKPADASAETCRQTFIENLGAAAKAAAERGIDLLIEPLNTRDMPGYLLTSQAAARTIIEAVGVPNLRLQLDLYHCQIMEGDLATHIRDYADIVGHVQIAGVPGRHEPNVGEINYPFLFEVLDEVGYQGWVGCEYRPRHGTFEGLGWLQAL